MGRHIIVSGDNALATTIIEELNKVGANVVKLAGHNLADAGLELADAVVCAGDDDARNLEIALLARKTNPNVRVVARLGNAVLREAVAADNGPGAILDVADLAAPSVVEACLADTAHPFEAAGIRVRRLGRRGAPRGDPARDLRRPGTGRGHPRQELPHPRRSSRLSGTRSPRPPRRLDRDDRQRRGIGRSRHQDPRADGNAGPPFSVQPNSRCGARAAQRRQPDVLSLAGRLAVSVARVDGLIALIPTGCRRG